MAREAMEAVIDDLLGKPGLDRLTADGDPRNMASIGLLARLGFPGTRRAEGTIKWRDGWCDSVYSALDRGAWQARRGAG